MTLQTDGVIRAVTGSLLCLVASMAQAGENSWDFGGPPGGDSRFMDIDPIDSSRIAVGVGAQLYVGVDEGVTCDGEGTCTVQVSWTRVTDSSSGFSGAVFDPSQSGVVIFSKDDRVGTYAVESGGLDTQSSPSSGLATLAVSADGSRVYGSTVMGEVFVSTDGGASWSQTGATFPVIDDTQTFAEKMLVHPTDPTTVYAVVSDAGVYRTTDGGDTWSEQNTGVTSNFTNDLAVDPADGDTLYRVTNLATYRSSDGGATWAELSPPASLGRVSVDPEDGALIGSTLGSSMLYKSLDQGASWTNLAQGPEAGPIRYLRSHGVGDDRIYAGTTTGIHIYVPSEGIWLSMNENLAGTIVEQLVQDPNQATRIYARTTRAGLFRSTDGGENWESANDGLPPNQTAKDRVYTDLIVDPSTEGRLLVSAPDNSVSGVPDGGLFQSTDGGSSWSPLTDQLTAIFVRRLAVDPTSPTTIYAGASGGTLVKSSDGGENWSTIGAGLPSEAPADLHVSGEDGDIVFWLSPSSGLYTSTDGGLSFQQTAAGLTETSLRMIQEDPQDSGALYIGTSFAQLFRSTDLGANWSPITADTDIEGVYDIAFDTFDPQTIYLTPSNGAPAWRSLDGGSSWESLDLDYPQEHGGLAIAAGGATPYTVYVGTGGLGVAGLTISPDLRAAFQGGTKSSTEGSSTSLTLNITNQSTVTATGVRVQISADGDASIEGASPSNGSCDVSDGAAACSVESLAGLGQFSIELNISTPEAGTVTVDASVEGDQSDPNADNDSDTKEIDVAEASTGGGSGGGGSGGSGGGGSGGGGTFGWLLLVALGLVARRRSLVI